MAQVLYARFHVTEALSNEPLDALERLGPLAQTEEVPDISNGEANRLSRPNEAKAID